MIAGVLWLLAGILAALALPVMPPSEAGLLSCLLAIRPRYGPLRHLRWLPLGFGLAVLDAGSILADRMPGSLAGRDWLIEGEVDELLSDRPERVAFRFTPHGPDLPSGIPRRVRLVWYGAPVPPAAGERWRLVVRLREPRGTANPHGFDYERWLFTNGIGATGYVRTSSRNRRLGEADDLLHRIRSRISDAIHTHLGKGDKAGLLEALVTGNRAGISPETRRQLMVTGTAHLLAISGLHVSISAATGAAVGTMLGRMLAAGARRSAGAAGWIGAVFAASGYACLAGTSVATWRALVMVVVVALALGSGRHFVLPRSLALAAWLVLLVRPVTPMDGGFWLSFGAVALLCLRFAGRRQLRGRIRALVEAQAALCAGMIVPSLAFFGFVPATGFLVNLVAVPLVSMVVLPAALVGALLALVDPILGGTPLRLAAGGLTVLLQITGKAAAIGPGILEPALADPGFLILAGVATLLLLFSAAVPGWRAAPVILVPVLLWRGHLPPPGGLEVTVLDVGQGLSAVVRTHRRSLIYDAGPAWTGGDAGALTVRPFVRGQGPPKASALVISHGDADHAGGAQSLLDRIDGPVLTGPGTRLESGATHICRKGQSWIWDGVSFEFLHPPAGYEGDDNGASCVLRIASPSGSVLLPGDIGSGVERALVRTGADVSADLVVAPHHGSATSSSQAFVDAAAPAWVVFTTAYRNRWGFPRREVQDRWRASAARTLDTSRQGALRFVFDPAAGQPSVSGWRCESRRFWRYRHCDADLEN